ncbi:MAG: glycosyltransferase family 4 protein [bacterium]|nr:glycosyltransferase family 4 protein [bacterium]
MNLLVINLDKAIFSKNSASLERLKEYSELTDKMFVIVWTKNKEQMIVYNNKLFIYPTNSCCRLFYYFASLGIAGKILKHEKIDLIFTQDPFETGLAGWLIAKIYKIKLQLQIHTDIFSPYFELESLANKLRVLLGKFLIKRADSFRVVSRRIKESLVKLSVPAEKIFVFPIFTDFKKNAGQPIRSDLKSKYPRFNFIVLMICRLSPEKNIPLAISAMADIVRLRPGAGLVIIGSGRESEEIIKFGKNKLGGMMVWEKWTDDPVSYYKSADLFLLTSNYEGWSLAVIEAASFGLPIIMTDVGCAGEAIKNGESGMIIPVGNKEKLVEVLLKIIEDENLRKKLGANAKLAVNRLPNKEQTLNLYKISWQKAVLK